MANKIPNTKNVRKTAIIGFVITGILALIGSLLI
jgi:hypothetical protein